MQSHNGEPKFEPAFQNCHYNVTFPNAEALKIGRSLVSVLFHFSESKLTAFTLIVRPEQSTFIRFLLGPGINNVVSKIKIIGNN